MSCPRIDAERKAKEEMEKYNNSMIRVKEFWTHRHHGCAAPGTLLRIRSHIAEHIAYIDPKRRTD